MNKNKIITLDLTGCKCLGELHQRIKTAFNFPDGYGENWNAFSDFLWSECDADKVEILGEHTLSQEFKHELELMHEVLLYTKKDRKKYGAIFDYEIIN